MTSTDMLIDILSRSRERFDRALDGVTVEQANTQPTPELAPRVDSLTWLAWHTAREIDTQDWRHTPEEAAQVVVGDLDTLVAYLDDAYALAAAYLRGLTPQVLDEVIDRSWDPPVTRAVRLASIIDDAAQHSGQAVYTRRLLGLPG